MALTSAESKAMVLLVDDDRVLCDSIASVLREGGYCVVNVYTGVEALEASREHPFDAVILDIKLPDIDGVELLRNIREVDPVIGTLMLSGAATLEDAVESLNQGADAFILKPVEPDDLFSRIDRVIRLKTLEKRLRESVARYRLLVESSSDGIVALSLDWIVRFVNQSFLDLVGLPREEVVGRSFASFMMPFRSRLLLDTIQGAIDEGRTVLPRFGVHGRDGVLVSVEASTALLERDGGPVGVQMILRDVSGREEARRRDLGLAFDLNGVSPGGSYVHVSREAALRIFGNMVLHGAPGLLFTRENPDALVSRYGFSPDVIVLLSSTRVQGYESVEGLDGLGAAIGGFLDGNEAAMVVIDGLSYLVANHGFDGMYRLLSDVKFEFQKKRGVLLVPLDPAALTDRQRALLTSELKLVG